MTDQKITGSSIDELDCKNVDCQDAFRQCVADCEANDNECIKGCKVHQEGCKEDC